VLFLIDFGRINKRLSGGPVLASVNGCRAGHVAYYYLSILAKNDSFPMGKRTQVCVGINCFFFLGYKQQDTSVIIVPWKHTHRDQYDYFYF
jgi:hypothetical protein